MTQRTIGIAAEQAIDPFNNFRDEICSEEPKKNYATNKTNV